MRSGLLVRRAVPGADLGSPVTSVRGKDSAALPTGGSGDRNDSWAAAANPGAPEPPTSHGWPLLLLACELEDMLAADPKSPAAAKAPARSP